MNDPTLAEALEKHGLRYEWSPIVDKRAIVEIATGKHLGDFDAAEAWELIKTRSREFFVSAMDGTRYALLAGPFPSQEDALQSVPVVNRKACELDPRADFWAFGTCSFPAGCGRKGALNDCLTMEPSE